MRYGFTVQRQQFLVNKMINVKIDVRVIRTLLSTYLNVWIYQCTT